MTPHDLGQDPDPDGCNGDMIIDLMRIAIVVGVGLTLFFRLT